MPRSGAGQCFVPGCVTGGRSPVHGSVVPLPVFAVVAALFPWCTSRCIRRGSSVVIVGCRVLVLGHHRRVVVFSRNHIPIVVVGEPMGAGARCCRHWLLAPTIHPASSGSQGWGRVLGRPLSLWGAGAGVGLFLVVVGHWCLVSSS
jgi:hypothetical protein